MEHEDLINNKKSIAKESKALFSILKKKSSDLEVKSTNLQEANQQSLIELSALNKLSSNGLALIPKKEAKELLSYDTALSLKVLPITVKKQGTKKGLVVASMQNDHNADLEKLVKFIAGVDFIEIVKLELNDIENAIFKAYNLNEEKLIKASLELVTNKTEEPKKTEKPLSLFRESQNEIPKFFTSLIDYAISKNASDLHIVPRKNGSFITLRVAGNLLTHEEPIVSSNLHTQLINRLKILSKLDISKKGISEGSFTVDLPKSEINIRVAIMPSVNGEKAVLRFPTKNIIPDLEELGFEQEILNALINTLHKKSGLILFSGATGSGKSTSLYSSLKYLKTLNRNIVTLEDPVEAHITGITQTSLDAKNEVNYVSGLKTILRHDPDVIMLGEIRDKESCEHVAQAVLTGHLVLSTIHGGSPIEALARFERLGVLSQDIPYVLSLVISQKLLKKICTNCSVIDLVCSTKAGFKVYKAVGCQMCDYTGYQGSVLASGGLAITKELKDLILDDQAGSILSIADKISDRSYRPLSNSIKRLFEEGQIDLSEI